MPREKRREEREAERGRAHRRIGDPTVQAEEQQSAAQSFILAHSH